VNSLLARIKKCLDECKNIFKDFLKKNFFALKSIG
jgi:hypothetical protein